MPNPKLNLGWALLLVALPATAAPSAEGDRIAVDVVVDFNAFAHTYPAPDQPAYYLPVFGGYRNFGYADYAPESSLPKQAVEHLLVDALASRDYLIMTKQSPPSLVLICQWGYLSPLRRDPQQYEQLRPGGAAPPSGPGSPPAFGPGADPAAALQSVFSRQLSGQTSAQMEARMLSMVAGDTLKDRRHTGDDPPMARARELAKEPIYYILISAFDFDSWLHHQRRLVWQEHICTRLWGRSFGEVLPAMVAAATPLFGRETREPRFVEIPRNPSGRVEVGAAVVKNPSAPPPKNP